MENGQTPPPTQNTNEWFNAVPAPAPAPTGATGRAPKKHLLLVVVIGFILLAGIVAAFIFIPPPAAQPAQAATPCLTVDDLTELTGAESSEMLSPTANFYTDFVEFEQTTASYSTSPENADHTEALVTKLAGFITAKAANAPKVALSASYTQANGDIIAKQRLSKVKDDLTKHGVSAAAITVSDPLLVQYEDDSSNPDTTAVTITLTSPAGCR